MFSTFAAFSGLAFFLGLRTTGLAIVVLSFCEVRARGSDASGWWLNVLLVVCRLLAHAAYRISRTGDQRRRIRRGARRRTARRRPSHPAGRRPAEEPPPGHRTDRSPTGLPAAGRRRPSRHPAGRRRSRRSRHRRRRAGSC